MSRLPIELYKIIIDNLDAYEDKTTLRACSLTCKAFLHASRYHLFRHLHLRSGYQARLLSNSWTSPCAYVRHLSLYGMRDLITYEPRWLNDVLPLIVTHLPDITTLRLSSLEWESLNHAARSAILSGFCKVEHLEIRFMRFNTSSQMNELIASFPSLMDLVCHLTRWTVYEVPVIPLPPNIESITLASLQSIFFDQLLSLQAHHDLRTIKFRRMWRYHLQGVGKLLKTLGSRLEHLDFNSLPYTLIFNTQALPERHIDLTHNTNLRSISLDPQSYTPGVPDSVFDIWSQITSCHLMEQVALEIHLAALADLDAFDWPRIDRYFAQKRWSELHKFAFILGGKGEIRPEASALIKSRLPLLEGRGVLSVVVS